MTESKPLTAAQETFLCNLLADPKQNVVQAYMRAYPSANYKSANSAGGRLLKDPRIAARRAVLMAELKDRALLTAEDISRQLAELATADPRDLVEFRRGACRYCWGAGHLYHRTPREYREAWAVYQASRAGQADPLGLSFDHQGGVGYNMTRDPHPDCPECFGLGQGYDYVKDSRTLTQKAARLFAGVKRTKAGVQILTHSQDGARELSAKILGMTRPAGEGDDERDVPPAATTTYRAKDASRPK